MYMGYLISGGFIRGYGYVPMGMHVFGRPHLPGDFFEIWNELRPKYFKNLYWGLLERFCFWQGKNVMASEVDSCSWMCVCIWNLRHLWPYKIGEVGRDFSRYVVQAPLLKAGPVCPGLCAAGFWRWIYSFSVQCSFCVLGRWIIGIQRYRGIFL